LNVFTLYHVQTAVELTVATPSFGVTSKELQADFSIGSQVVESQPPLHHQVLVVSPGSQVSSILNQEYASV
jgi:hypothetical protein